MQSVVFILVFASVLLSFVGLYLLWTNRRTVSKDFVLERMVPRETGDALASEQRTARLRNAGWVETVCAPFIRLDLLAPLLSSIGIPCSAATFLWIVLLSGALPFALCLAASGSVSVGFIAAFIGLSVPFAYLTYRRKRTERKLVEQFPDALEFTVRALRAGQSLDKALQGLASNLTEPMSGQIRFIYDEMSLGLPFAEAFRRFESRFPKVAEVKIFCTALIVHRETGGNLVRILEVLSDNIRQRMRLDSQIKATTAEVRITGIILGLLPFALLGVFYLLNPEYIRVLFIHPVGRKLLLSAAGLELIGFSVMRAMTRVEM